MINPFYERSRACFDKLERDHNANWMEIANRWNDSMRKELDDLPSCGEDGYDSAERDAIREKGLAGMKADHAVEDAAYLERIRTEPDPNIPIKAAMQKEWNTIFTNMEEERRRVNGWLIVLIVLICLAGVLFR